MFFFVLIRVVEFWNLELRFNEDFTNNDSFFKKLNKKITDTRITRTIWPKAEVSMEIVAEGYNYTLPPRFGDYLTFSKNDFAFLYL